MVTGLDDSERVILAILSDTKAAFQVSDLEKSLRDAIELADEYGELDLAEIRNYRATAVFWSVQRLLRSGLVERRPRGYAITATGTEAAKKLPASRTAKTIVARATPVAL